MMNEWREAVRLAMFEWKASWKGLLRNFLYCGLLFMLFKLLLDGGLRGFATLPAVLLFGSILPIGAIGETKPFGQMRINSLTYADSQLAMLKTLAAPRGIIVKRQYILMLLRSFPWLAAMFALLYFATPDRQLVISVTTFIAFALIWISLSISVGGGLALFYCFVAVYVKWLSYALLICFMLIFYGVTGNGEQYPGYSILYWFTQAAEKHAMPTIIISIATATASSVLWQALLKRRLERIDLL